MSDPTTESRGRAPSRQPIFNVPWPITATLALLVGIHGLRQLVPEGLDDAVFTRLAFVPGRLSYAVAPGRVWEAGMALARQGAEGYRLAQAERFFLGDGSAEPWTTVTYALLHGSWSHVGLNAIWLLAFGTPVVRRFAALRFSAFLAVSAFAGAAAQWAAHPLELAPVIGASAAVSGCMGATLRFMFQPRVPMAAIVGAAGAGRGGAFLRPALSLRAVGRDSRAVAFIVAWFATNFLFGLGSPSLGMAGGSAVAWQAHIGGFLVGLLLFALFDPVRDAGPADIEAPEPASPAAER